MTFPASMLNPGEHVVITTRSHPKALIGPILVFVLAVAAAIAIGLVDVPVLAIVVWVLLAGLVVWWVVRPVVDWLTTTYTFTNRRFVKRSGFIAKEGRTIPLNRVSGVDFEIGLIDRLFGCGTLVVSDASTDGVVELHDIPQVEQVQLKVAEELHRLTSSDTSRHGDDGN